MHYKIDCPRRGQCITKSIAFFKGFADEVKLSTPKGAIDCPRKGQCITPVGVNRLPFSKAMHSGPLKKKGIGIGVKFKSLILSLILSLLFLFFNSYLI